MSTNPVRYHETLPSPYPLIRTKQMHDAHTHIGSLMNGWMGSWDLKLAYLQQRFPFRTSTQDEKRSDQSLVGLGKGWKGHHDAGVTFSKLQIDERTKYIIAQGTKLPHIKPFVSSRKCRLSPAATL